MQQNKRRYTITDLTTIFHVSRTSIQSRLNNQELTLPLMKHHHIIRVGSRQNQKRKRYLFDDKALLKIAISFKGKIPNRKSKSSKHNDSKLFQKAVLKDVSNIDRKLNLIINKLHITY